jgi:hypothetical protein
MISAGGFALVLGTEGISVGFALDPALPPDLAFPLPSDTIFGERRFYPDRTDPTGKLMKNEPIFPGESAESTDDKFLTYTKLINSNPLADYHRRLDESDTACNYYVAIGAVDSCGGSSNGTLLGALINPTTFQAWKNEVGIDNDAQHPGTPTNVARFINQVDLNLTRDHHMIYYSRDKAAAYVCNHKGSSPTARDPTGLFPPQDEIDALIKGIKPNSTENAIACVAMEFSTRGQRGQPPSPTPFTKFLIFGPDGALWSTVDLDGRGPKGVPNVCTACHGGKFDYEDADGQFEPNIATLRPPGDLAAHFLPFDIANFAFSSDLTTDQQEQAIFKMNQAVYNIERDRWTTGPDGFVNDGFGSLSIQKLIAGWYGDVTPANTAPYLDRNYIPPRWDADGIHHDAYFNAYSHSCRTCHVAMDRAAAEEDPNVISYFAKPLVCDQPTSFFSTNEHVMPNAKVTFDRFWLSLDLSVSPPDVADQPFYLARLIANPLPAQLPLSQNPGVPCDKPKATP